MNSFLVGLVSGMIVLLLSQRIHAVYERRAMQERKRAEKEREKNIQSSLNNAGLGLSTEGLTVSLRNNTSVQLNIRRVELLSADGSKSVHLLHDLDSVDELPAPLASGEERVTVARKFSRQHQGPTQQCGILTPETCAKWVLCFDLADLVNFKPVRLRCIVEYRGLDIEPKVISVDAKRLLGTQLEDWISAWRQKAVEQLELKKSLKQVANKSIKLNAK